MNRFIQIFVFVVFLLFGHAEAKLFNMQKFMLNNGLEVIVIPNHKAPIIKQMVWYKVGSIDEPLGKGGLAHLLEHLMFRGTYKVPQSSFNDIVAAHGGESNAFTSQDFTAYYEFVDISRLEVVMALEADRMANLNITPEAFEAERKIVFQERQQRISNNPSAVFSENLERTLWQDKPYGRPIIGAEKEIEGLQLSDAVDFYNSFYSPDNAVLILAGDIDFKTANALAEKYFGKIEKRQIKNSKISANSTSNKAVYRLEQAFPEIASPRIIKKYITPSLLQNSKSAYALMLFSKYLGEGDTSYLNRNLVLTGKAAMVASAYNGFSRGDGSFTIMALPVPDISVAQTEEMLYASIKKALLNFNAQTLQKEKHKMLSGLVYVRDNPEDSAMLAGELIALGLSLEEIENYEENIQAITLEEIKESVSKMLENSSEITGVLLPKQAAPNQTKEQK